MFLSLPNDQAEWKAAQMDENAIAGLENEEEDGVCLTSPTQLPRV